MAQQGMFVRKASGLVRSWSLFDGFVYSLFSINLVALGFFIFSFAPYLPEANLLTAIVISGIFIIFEVFVYALLVAVMPRAGGDYVWQSRILGGGHRFCPFRYRMGLDSVALGTLIRQYALLQRLHADFRDPGRLDR